MTKKWNRRTLLYRVQLDYESRAREREVRLAGPKPQISDPIRVALSGAEVEGEIVDVEGSIIHVQLRPSLGAKTERVHQTRLDAVTPRMAKATTHAKRKKRQVR